MHSQIPPWREPLIIAGVDSVADDLLYWQVLFFVPVVLILAWLPLVPAGLGASLWFGVFHIGYKLADTLFMIPMEAWGAQLTPDASERNVVWSCRFIFQSVGVLFGVGIIPVLFADESCLSSPADGCVQFPLFAFVFGIMHCLGCLTLFYSGKEPTLSQLEQLGGAKVVQDGFSASDTVPLLMSTAMNWPFRCLMVAQITKAVGVEVPMVVMPFLTGSYTGENCIASGQLFGYLVIIVLCATLLAMPFWKLLSNKIGVYNTVVVYEVGQAVTLLTFLCSGYDKGDCSATYTIMFCSFFWGLSNTGSYLIKDLACDSVDYDEFLTGGLRREANYLMALEFVPKFMNIPGECLPFLIMAYLGYAAPPNAQPDCVTDVNTTSVNVVATSVDNFCHVFYSSELPGEDLCSYTRTCADVVSDGVKFVCLQAKGTNGQCGVKQNDNVITLLVVCFAVIPAFFLLGRALRTLVVPESCAHTSGAASSSKGA